MRLRWLMVVAVLPFSACSNSSTPAPTAQNPNPGPDNFATRYVENLQRDEQRAQSAADKANAAIAREQQMANQAANPQ